MTTSSSINGVGGWPSTLTTASPAQTGQSVVTTNAPTTTGSTTTSLSNTGGGLTLRPTESVSGNNEVHIDPTHLIDYQADDGTSVTETPAGLLLHELGHASLLNSGDSAQTMGGPQAEANVRTLTNPIRTELGMKPER